MTPCHNNTIFVVKSQDKCLLIKIINKNNLYVKGE